MAGIDTYETTITYEDQAVTFLFMSKGNRAIVKAVEYRFVQKLLGRSLYNLGFGDYEIDAGRILDHTDTNNGDPYKVFHTILHTIPIFFDIYPEAMVLVQGSDSTMEFEVACRKTCKRKCVNDCKKHHRRIRIYCNYVDRNFMEISKRYVFFGVSIDDNHAVMEPYQTGRAYIAVFLHLRALSL
ncbi:MAG TPA: hypothetical protein VHK91_16870 [Flavisolibacter sp.]|jgi:hypothetical protein|nr:hypothetical protein [Flavisolibacter sp.]